MAPIKQAGGRSVGCHGLVALVLRGKGVAIPDPSACKVRIHRRGFLKVAFCLAVLADQVVVATDGEPRFWVEWLIVDLDIFATTTTESYDISIHEIWVRALRPSAPTV